MTKYNDERPAQVIEMMSKGLLDCHICAQWGISRETFYEWVRTKPEFKAAYEEGIAKAEAKFLQFAMERMEAGDDKGYKYWISIMNNKFGSSGWARDNKGGDTKNTQININNMNVIQSKSDQELIEFIQNKLEANGLLIDGSEESSE